MRKTIFTSQPGRVAIAFVLVVGLGALGHRAVSAKPASYYAPSNAQTIVRGHFPINRPPVLTVPSGATVVIDTVSHQGLGGDGKDPVNFLAGFGIPESEVLPDATDIFYNYRTPTGASTHVLTGPIYVDGAEPGDTLEVRILDVKPRVTWGFNTQGTGGALPGYLTASFRKLYRLKGNVAIFNDDIEIALKPFQGIMAVAPASDYVSPITEAAAAGLVSARPPGPFGGNMDLNDLGEGTSLYLPVFQPGAQFFTGDPHAVQGNGEISGNALELSNTITVQFFLHKGGGLTMPRAETPTHYILMGIDPDHDEALKKAIRETLDFMVAEKGLTPQDAYSFASVAVDFNIAESVDFNQLVMGRIPKRFFKTDYAAKPQFWHHKEVRMQNETQRQGLDPIR